METPDSLELTTLRAALAGDSSGLGALLESYRDRLRRMVDLRMDTRLRGRVDPSDVIQDAFLEVNQHLQRYVDDPRIPFYLWVRFLAGRKLRRVHRTHLGTQKRDAAREVRVGAWVTPGASSIALAEVIADGGPTPSRVVSLEEQRRRIVEVLDSLRQEDREVLALRHFEQLTNVEIAALLDITENAAHLRYMRAARRLKDRLSRALSSPTEGNCE